MSAAISTKLATLITLNLEKNTMRVRHPLASFRETYSNNFKAIVNIKSRVSGVTEIKCDTPDTVT